MGSRSSHQKPLWFDSGENQLTFLSHQLDNGASADSRGYGEAQALLLSWECLSSQVCLYVTTLGKCIGAKPNLTAQTWPVLQNPGEASWVP